MSDSHLTRAAGERQLCASVVTSSNQAPVGLHPRNAAEKCLVPPQVDFPRHRSRRATCLEPVMAHLRYLQSTDTAAYKADVGLDCQTTRFVQSVVYSTKQKESFAASRRHDHLTRCGGSAQHIKRGYPIETSLPFFFIVPVRHEERRNARKVWGFLHLLTLHRRLCDHVDLLSPPDGASDQRGSAPLPRESLRQEPRGRNRRRHESTRRG